MPCAWPRAFRRADEEALTYQIRFAYRFHRFRLLAHHGRQIVQADGASVEIGDDGLKHCYIQTVKTFGIDLISANASLTSSGRTDSRSCTMAQSLTRRSRRLAILGVPRERMASWRAAPSSNWIPNTAEERSIQLFKLLMRVEIQMRRETEPRTQRRGKHALSRGGTDNRKPRQCQRNG